MSRDDGLQARRREAIVEYMLLIYGDEAAWAARPADERRRELERHFDFESRHRVIRGQGLAPTTEATTVRMSDGKPTFTDGPYAETKEQLGGYYLVECNSREEALEAARELAALVSPEWATIELRPLGGVDARGRVRVADRPLDA
jgi:hypothetical protein